MAAVHCFKEIKRFHIYSVSGNSPKQQSAIIFHCIFKELHGWFWFTLHHHTMRRAYITPKVAGKLLTALIRLRNERVSGQTEHEIEIQLLKKWSHETNTSLSSYGVCSLNHTLFLFTVFILYSFCRLK